MEAQPMKVTKCPKEVLSQSPEDKLKYYQQLRIAHPYLSEAYNKLYRAVRNAEPGSLIYLYGPAGVGKTTLLKRLCEDLAEESAPELKSDCQKLSFVYLETAATDAVTFSWKDFFQRFLLAIPEVLPKTRKIPLELEKLIQSNAQALARPNIVGGQLRVAAENTLKYRRPKAVIFDEAQHFTFISSGRKLLDQHNVLKSFASISRSVFVLAGTYELLPFRNLNGQLSRRSRNVHFTRYSATVKEQRQIFINSLHNLQQHLPLAETPNLVSNWDYFYERSIGCIGILKKLLTNSLEWVLKDENSCFEDKLLEECALSIEQCRRLLIEAEEGENQIIEEESSRQTFREKLGLDVKDCGGNLESQSDDATLETSRVPRKKSRAVGVRNARRDSIHKNL